MSASALRDHVSIASGLMASACSNASPASSYWPAESSAIPVLCGESCRKERSRSVGGRTRPLSDEAGGDVLPVVGEGGEGGGGAKPRRPLADLFRFLTFLPLPAPWRITTGLARAAWAPGALSSSLVSDKLGPLHVQLGPKAPYLTQVIRFREAGSEAHKQGEVCRLYLLRLRK